MLQIDPGEEFKYPYVYQTNYSMPIDPSQIPPSPSPPLSRFARQFIVPPQTSPAHLYQLPYFPNQSIPQNSLPPPPPPNNQQDNPMSYQSNQLAQYYFPYIQVIKLSINAMLLY